MDIKPSIGLISEWIESEPAQEVPDTNDLKRDGEMLFDQEDISPISSTAVFNFMFNEIEKNESQPLLNKFHDPNSDNEKTNCLIPVCLLSVEIQEGENTNQKIEGQEIVSSTSFSDDVEKDPNPEKKNPDEPKSPEMSSTMGERQSESLKKKKKKSNGEVFAATSVKDVVEKDQNHEGKNPARQPGTNEHIGTNVAQDDNGNTFERPEIVPDSSSLGSQSKKDKKKKSSKNDKKDKQRKEREDHQQTLDTAAPESCATEINNELVQINPATYDFSDDEFINRTPPKPQRRNAQILHLPEESQSYAAPNIRGTLPFIPRNLNLSPDQCKALKINVMRTEVLQSRGQVSKQQQQETQQEMPVTGTDPLPALSAPSEAEPGTSQGRQERGTRLSRLSTAARTSSSTTMDSSKAEQLQSMREIIKKLEADIEDMEIMLNMAINESSSNKTIISKLTSEIQEYEVALNQKKQSRFDCSNIISNALAKIGQGIKTEGDLINVLRTRASIDDDKSVSPMVTVMRQFYQDQYDVIPVTKYNYAFEPADGIWYNAPIRDKESFRVGRILPVPGRNKYEEYRPGETIPAPGYFDVNVRVTVVNKHFALDEKDYRECTALIEALYNLEEKDKATYPVFKIQGSGSTALLKRRPYLKLEGILKGTYNGKPEDEERINEKVHKGERDINIGSRSTRIKDYALIHNFLLVRLLHAIWPIETHSMLRADPTQFLYRDFHEIRYNVLYDLVHLALNPHDQKVPISTATKMDNLKLFIKDQLVHKSHNIFAGMLKSRRKECLNINVRDQKQQVDDRYKIEINQIREEFKMKYVSIIRKLKFKFDNLNLSDRQKQLLLGPAEQHSGSPSGSPKTSETSASSKTKKRSASKMDELQRTSHKKLRK